jgi:hypothetical protein
LTVNGSVSGFRVNQGLTQRSFIRYLELTLDSNESAQLLLANPQRVSLVKADLNGEGSEAIALDAKLSVVDDKVTVDFGVNGLGDNRLSNVGDGYYTFSVDLDGDGVGEVKFHFYRLLGDINGDREVTSADTQLVYAAIQARDAYDPNLDINGDGRINSSDLLLAQFAIGRKLKSTLVITS